MSPVLLILLLALLIYCVLGLGKYLLNHYRLYQGLKSLPGPAISNPLIGHLGLFLGIVWNNPIDQYGIKLNQLMNELCDQYDQDGVGLVRLWFGPFMPWVIVNDAKVSNLILQHPDYMARARFYDPFQLVAGQELLNLAGRKFIEEKKKFLKFFKLSTMDAYVPQIESHLKVFNNKVEERIQKNGGRFGNAEKLVAALVFDCVGDSFFNTKFESQLLGLPKQLHLIHDLLKLITLLILTPWNYFLKPLSPVQLLCTAPFGILGLGGLVKIRLFIYNIIKNRRKNVKLDLQNQTYRSQLPMLDSMIQSQLTNSLDRVDNIDAHITTFMVAGHDATTTTLSWVLYLLCHHPEEQQKCRDEVERYYADLEASGQPPSYSNLKSLKYLECCIKESLRIYCPGPFLGRRGRVPLPINGYTVQPGVNLVIFLERLHHREDYFRESEKFLPERFLNPTEPECNLQAYIPFSIGHTSCIGKEYAMILIKLFLVRMLIKYDFAAEDRFGDTKQVYTFMDKPADFPLKISARKCD